MRSEKLYLIDIVKAANDVEKILHGVEEAEFVSNDTLRSAIAHKLMTIGEAASRLSQEFHSAHPEIIWKSVKGFRNIVAHEYFSLVWSIVWATAKISVPEIREQIIAILKVEYPDFPEILDT